jgi:hypothetical protein
LKRYQNYCPKWQVILGLASTKDLCRYRVLGVAAAEIAADNMNAILAGNPSTPI